VHPDHPLAPPPSGEPHDDIIYPHTIPFVLVHLACFGAIWTGVTWEAVWVGLGLYVIRMFGVTAGYHRYFSHRSYKTSRGGQFLLASLAQSSAQRGALWWAAIHRHHHLHSDTPEDIHSPEHMGFWGSHVGWIFRPKRNSADYTSIRDFTQYPELVFLNRFHLIPAIVLAVAMFLWGGWVMLVVGFFWSTVLLYHGTFLINSLAHVMGSQRYVTGDDSRNNFLLAVLTLGEGWHNNHHHYQSATAQGWRWYEFDPTYYVLKVLSWLGIVWDLRAPPKEVVDNARPLGRKTLENVAVQLAATVPVSRMVDDLKERWDQVPGLDEIRVMAQKARDDAEERLVEYLESAGALELPTVEELRERAREMFNDTPSLDDIAQRARELVLEALSANLLEPVPQGA
jgi:stearoyl-CoA desaturase (delta-9 desaturase)